VSRNVTRRAALKSARCSSARALPRGTRSCGGGSRITRCGSAPSSRTSISSTSRSTGSQTRSRSRSAPFARAVELLCTITGIQHRGAQCILADIGTIICAIWHMLSTGAVYRDLGRVGSPNVDCGRGRQIGSALEHGVNVFALYRAAPVRAGMSRQAECGRGQSVSPCTRPPHQKTVWEDERAADPAGPSRRP
jgi:hypothetical protein